MSPWLYTNTRLSPSRSSSDVSLISLNVKPVDVATGDSAKAQFAKPMISKPQPARELPEPRRIGAACMIDLRSLRHGLVNEAQPSHFTGVGRPLPESGGIASNTGATGRR